MFLNRIDKLHNHDESIILINLIFDQNKNRTKAW